MTEFGVVAQVGRSIFLRGSATPTSEGGGVPASP